MATKTLQTVTDTAENKTEVSTKVQALLDTYSITGDDIESLEVTEFGTNQFFITLIYLESLEKVWQWDHAGLAATLEKIRAAARAFSATSGLTSSLGRAYGKQSSLQPALGLVSSIDRLFAKKLELKPSSGLASSVSGNIESKTSRASLGLSCSVSRNITEIQGIYEDVGLSCTLEGVKS